MKKAVAMLALSILIFTMIGCKGAPQTGDGTKGKKAVEEAQKRADEMKKGEGSTVGTELDKILAKKKDTVFTGNYDFETKQGTTTSFSGTQIQYFKYPNLRIDTNSTINGQASISSVFQLDKKSYTCSTVNGKTTCFDLSSMAAPSGSSSNQFNDYSNDLENNLSKYKIIFSKKESIAGEQGLCYDVSSGDVSTYTCFTQDGILLKSDYQSSQMSFKMTATKIDRSVSDSVFKLPAEPTAMPVMPGNIPTPPRKP